MQMAVIHLDARPSHVQTDQTIIQIQRMGYVSHAVFLEREIPLLYGCRRVCWVLRHAVVTKVILDAYYSYHWLCKVAAAC